MAAAAAPEPYQYSTAVRYGRTINTAAMSRSYEVTFTSSELPVALRILTFPYAACPELIGSPYVQTATEEAAAKAALLGLRIERPIRYESLPETMTQIVRDAANGLGLPYDYADLANRIDALISELESSEAISFEQSPLAGHGFHQLTGGASFVGVAVSLSLYAIAAHNPLILAVTPFGVMIMGAAVGTAEGLRSGLRDVTEGFVRSLQSTRPAKPVRRRKASPVE
jgi:hypothetical protein